MKIKKGFETCPHGEDCAHCDCTFEECADIRLAQARTYIQQLEQKVDSLQEYQELADFLGDKVKQLEAQVPRWISVEERLPKEFETVIIWRSDCHQACIGWLIGGHWSVPKGVQVTHWMPLPEPPKEDA